MLTRWHGLLEQTASGDGGAFTGDAKWGGGRFSATFADSPRGGAHGLGKRAGRDHLHDLPLPVGVETAAAAVAFEPTPEVLAAARHSTEALEATRGSKSWTATTRADNDDEEVSSSGDGSPSQPKLRSLTTPRPLLRSDSAAAAGSRKQMLKQHTERTQRQKNNSKWRKRRNKVRLWGASPTPGPVAHSPTPLACSPLSSFSLCRCGSGG